MSSDAIPTVFGIVPHEVRDTDLNLRDLFALARAQASSPHPDHLDEWARRVWAQADALARSRPRNLDQTEDETDEQDAD